MSFVNPQFFWTMLLPLVVFTYFILTHQDTFAQVFDKKVLQRLSVHDDSLPLVIRNLLLILAIFFMIVAMARPVIEHGDRTMQLHGLSAVVALDISGSMRSQDIYPNRLEFAKKKIVQLLDAMPHDEFGLVAFAHASFLLAPFSSDKTTLQQLVQGVDDHYINMSSTNFTALGHFVVELLEKKEPKILILFSDGGEQKETEQFAQILKKNNIALYVVLVGTKEGAPVMGANGKPFTQNKKIVITQRNDDLGEIAIKNKGAFVMADTGNRDIEELVATIKAQHPSKNKSEVLIHDRKELFYYPLGVGLLFLLVGFSSLPKRRAS